MWETPRCFSSYFFTTPPLVSTLTGIVVSEDSMAGMIKGASTVSTPSGDREEVTFSMFTVEGRLEGSNRTQLGYQYQETAQFTKSSSVDEKSITATTYIKTD